MSNYQESTSEKLFKESRFYKVSLSLIRPIIFSLIMFDINACLIEIDIKSTAVRARPKRKLIKSGNEQSEH